VESGGLIGEDIAQSRALAARLHEEWMSVDLIPSSDLPRAAETTEIIAREIPVLVRYAPEWRETNNGDLAGMLNSEAEERYPGLYFASLEMDEPYPAARVRGRTSSASGTPSPHYATACLPEICPRTSPS
jgi:probable phosphoglycerate mutase